MNVLRRPVEITTVSSRSEHLNICHFNLSFRENLPFELARRPYFHQRSSLNFFRVVGRELEFDLPLQAL